MEREYDNRVVDYWQTTDFYNVAELIRDERIDDDDIIEDKNTMPLQLQVFAPRGSKKKTNKFVPAIDRLKMIKYNT